MSQGAGNCLDFDGSSQYVTFGSAPELQISGDLTLECWVNIPSAPTPPGYFGLITYGANGETEGANQLYTLRIANNGTNIWYQIAHEYGDEASPGDVVIPSSITPVFNQWVHIAVTRNAADTTYRFYINGLAGGVGTYTSEQAPTGGTSAAAILGGLFSSSGSGTTPLGYFLVGKMDEVRIWNTVRTQAQIRANLCRKLTGSETGLQGYWRLDESSGTLASDLTGNNGGTLTNMENSDWVTSGAPIGDVSTFLYAGIWTNQEVQLIHPNGDDMTVSSVTDGPTCVHVYYVDEAPNITTPPASLHNIDPLRYWGVWVPGGTNPTYTVEYNYDGHPGIVNESELGLATRASGDVTAWTDLGITPNTTNHTLTSTGQAGRIPQYILGSTTPDNPLPVELAAFTANLVNDAIQLQWTTFSEINNDGFEIWRSIDNDQNFQLLSSYQYNPELVGAGNSSSTHQYGYLDREIQDGHTYYYQLWDVSFGG
ncbi:MAG: LamG domain-containing protein, partial [Calditrichota bacterium]